MAEWDEATRATGREAFLDVFFGNLHEMVYSSKSQQAKWADCICKEHGSEEGWARRSMKVNEPVEFAKWNSLSLANVAYLSYNAEDAETRELCESYRVQFIAWYKGIHGEKTQ